MSTYIEYRRKLLVEDQANSKMIFERKKGINNSIDLIERFNFKCDLINPMTHFESYSHINKTEQEELQEAIINYNSNFYNELVRSTYKQLENANTIEEIAFVCKKCEKLCADLQSIVFISQKYFE